MEDAVHRTLTKGPFFGDYQPIDLGPNFSATQLDIVPGNTNMQFQIPAWSSTVVPELNGVGVLEGGQVTIDAVDLRTGVISLTASGNEIRAPEPSALALALASGVVLAARRRRTASR